MRNFRTCRHDAGPRTASTSRAKPVTRLAWLLVVYNIAVILGRAYVRASGSGARCGSRWPLCNGEILPSMAQSQTLIEFMHRVTSALRLWFCIF
jgi:heme a synthase